MRYLIFISRMSMLLFLSMSLNAQEKSFTVKGKVTDENGDPLIGATVLINGTQSGTITDIYGKYDLVLPDSLAILTFSYVGYASKVIPVDGREVVDISMPDLLESDEVVISIDIEEATFPSFDLPPPKPSAKDKIKRRYFRECATLGCIDSLLSQALEYNGYTDNSYLEAPDGFALVTKMEKINSDGTSTDLPYRWEVSNAVYKFSLIEYLKMLFQGPKGQYRVIVFVVTPESFNSNNETEVSSEVAQAWHNNGVSFLPEKISTMEYSSHKVFALIYEFSKSESDVDAKLVDDSPLSGRIHLEQSNILPWLQTQQ